MTMSFVRKQNKVQAIKLKESIWDERGKCLADIGDWLILEEGEQHYMSDLQFRLEYEEISDINITHLGKALPYHTKHVTDFVVDHTYSHTYAPTYFRSYFVSQL